MKNPRLGANQHDSTVLSGPPDAVVVAAPVEQEQRRLLLDRGYDTPACRQLAMDQGLVAHIPKTSAAAQPIPAPGDPQRHPPRRPVVEVGHSWFNRFRRLQTRWEKRQDLYLGFVELTACLITWRKLAPVARLKRSSGQALSSTLAIAGGNRVLLVPVRLEHVSSASVVHSQC
ncbi:transposase [Deinococcus hopiensis]|uniref:transposase n=1 Tax=Deinococcus hopiensis TaxID=309885 RepID=UPI0009FEB850